MKHIGQFIDDIGSAEILNLFVTSLNNNDVTTGIYSESYNNNNHEKPDMKIKNAKTKVQLSNSSNTF